MKQQIERYDGAYYVIDGVNKGQYSIVNSKDLTDRNDYLIHSHMIVRDQAVQQLNNLGLRVVAIVEYSPVMCLMIVNEG